LIFKTALRAISAAALIATALGVALVAGAIALGALLCQYIGLPGAAAVVALLAALTALVAGLLLKPRSQPATSDAADRDDVLGRILALARKRPLIAATATVAVGVFALRNPKLLGALVSALIAKEAVTPHRR
jgi:predicted MFS family arabinose efflux permease